MPSSHRSGGSNKSDIPTYQDAIEPVATHPVEVSVQPKTDGGKSGPHSPSSSADAREQGQHGRPELLRPPTEDQVPTTRHEEKRHGRPIGFLVRTGKGWFQYMKTKEFWIVLVLGQILSLCITATNTFSGLLADAGTNIPAFQTFFNYVLLNLIYTTYTIFKYGPKQWARILWQDGYRYFLLSFCDVEGNYFIVLAYRYTTILSVQLINFWAIVVVVVVSLIFLRVRYRVAQYIGIIVCVGGMGLLIGSDHITGANTGEASDALKGDLFALLGASFYGLSNVVEEFAVSKRPMYEVIGQLAFWGVIINGVQMGIFDRTSIQQAVWNSQVGGWLAGYTLILTLFYSLAPVLFRLSSAAFFNISLLTAGFWGVIIGIRVFHISVYFTYPIAFVLIILGMFVYFMTEGVLGEAEKPWLGEQQERGVRGIFTARKKTDVHAGEAGTPVAGVA